MFTTRSAYLLDFRVITSSDKIVTKSYHHMEMGKSIATVAQIFVDKHLRKLDRKS